MPYYRYTATFKDNSGGRTRFLADAGNFMSHEEAMASIEGKRAAVIIGQQQQMSSRACTACEFPSAHEVLIWANVCSIIDADKYDVLLLVDTTGNAERERERIVSENPLAEVLHSYGFDDALIPSDFLMWCPESESFVPKELSADVMTDYLRHCTQSVLNDFLFISASIVNISEIPAQPRKFAASAISEISDERIAVREDDMKTTIGFARMHIPLVRRGLNGTCEQRRLAKNVLDMHAVGELLRYVIDHDVRKMFESGSRHPLCRVANLSNFLSSRTCLPELVDAYLSGVPVSDIVA